MVTLPRVLAVFLIALSAAAAAAQVPQSPLASAPGAAPAVTPPAAVIGADARDAREVKNRLEQILRQYPPSVGQVLALDPSLLTTPAYTATYPALAAYVAQHPEILRDPTYYLATPFQRVRVLEGRERTGLEGLAAIMFPIFMVSVLAVFTASLARAVLVHRRWKQAAILQRDTQAKLLDRLTANEELLAYLHGPGKGLFDAAQIPAVRFPTDAPSARILWAIQAGLVLAFLGGGLQIARFAATTDDSRGFLFVLGVIAIAIGLGFIASAAASLVLSRKLGLIAAPAPDTNG
jgi:hypothetical protein